MRELAFYLSVPGPRACQAKYINHLHASVLALPLSLSLSLSFFLARQRVRCSKISRNPPERATFVRRKRTFRMIHPIKMTVQRERKWKVTRPVIPRPFLPLFFRGNVMRASTFPSLRVTRNDHRKWIM
jgi:hypothetical protein